MKEYEAAVLTKEAYETGNFDKLIEVMSDDYEHISFWVLEVIRGKGDAVDYYQGKGDAIRKSGSSSQGKIVKIIEAPSRVRPNGVFVNGERIEEDESFYNRSDKGKTAVLITQKTDEVIRVLAIPSLDEGGRLKQMLITEPDNYEFVELQSE